MDNLDDYVLSVQNYKEGNYEYETITSILDVIKAIESGKKFVFLEVGAISLIIVGFVFFILVLILTTIFYYFMYISLGFILFTFFFFLLLFGIFAIPILKIFIIPGFLMLRTPFIVLGAEGIVYKLKTGGIKGFNWEEISMDVVEETSDLKLNSMSSFQIYFSMPNSDFFNFGAGDYSLKEFPDIKQIGCGKAKALFLFTFVNYYNYGKKGSFEAQNF